MRHRSSFGDSKTALRRIVEFVGGTALSSVGPARDGAFRTILSHRRSRLHTSACSAQRRANARGHADHDEVLEAAVTEHGGRVVKTIGDAFMAEFAVPSAAVEAAIAAQRGIQAKFADSDVPSVFASASTRRTD